MTAEHDVTAFSSLVCACQHGGPQEPSASHQGTERPSRQFEGYAKNRETRDNSRTSTRRGEAPQEGNADLKVASGFEHCPKEAI